VKTIAINKFGPSLIQGIESTKLQEKKEEKDSTEDKDEKADERLRIWISQKRGIIVQRAAQMLGVKSTIGRISLSDISANEPRVKNTSGPKGAKAICQFWGLGGLGLVPGSRQSSYHTFLQAGLEGDPFSKAICLIRGEGPFPCKPEEAIAIWRNLSKLGCAYSKHMLSICYEKGRWVEKDKYHFLAYCQEAATMGNKKACIRMGKVLLHEAQISKDISKLDMAKAWFRTASGPPPPPSISKLENKTGDDLQIAELDDINASNSLLSPQSGDPDAQNGMGSCHWLTYLRKKREKENANTCHIEDEKKKKEEIETIAKQMNEELRITRWWLNKAAEQGHRAAMYNLGKLEIQLGNQLLGLSYFRRSMQAERSSAVYQLLISMVDFAFEMFLNIGEVKELVDKDVSDRLEKIRQGIRTIPDEVKEEKL
ncbi:hypothetical protein AAMO2058_001040300, partial [Amorphochlora amoebiformis]